MEKTSFCFLISFLVIGLPPQRSDWPTLAETIATLGTDTTGLPADLLRQRIVNIATANESGVLAVAYYLLNDSAAKPPLYVAVREPQQPWRQAGLTSTKSPQGGFGGPTRITVRPDLLLIDCHLNPSAGTLVVVERRRLTLIGELYGWLTTVLPTGLIVYTKSMMHWAPAHPAELHTFDPRTRRDARLYPTNYHSPARRAFVERLRPLFKMAEARDPGLPYGFDPEWYDVSNSQLEYVAQTDTLEFQVKFSSDRVPADISPQISETYRVRCRPMKQASRTCVESK
jgi:hypothetical protein